MIAVHVANLTTMSKARDRLIATPTTSWQQVTPGIERIDLATAIGILGHDIYLLRLAAGYSLPAPSSGHGREVLVVEGTWQLPDGLLTRHSYARRPPDQSHANHSEDGAVLLIHEGPFADADKDIVHLESSTQAWLPGQGNLRVQPLHSFGDEGTALVHWPAGERFKPHRHWGGEEIFVLSGTFEDEHGSYPSGTWLLSPHWSSHYPFVTEETVIFVKTGHLPQVAADQ